MALKMEGASPPVFEQIFRNARFAQGGNALFEGKVAGSPRPQVVWTRKGLQMKTSDKHQMTYEESSGRVSLLIKSIGPGDEGEYTCTALNPYGEAICTVYISPEATKQVKKSRSGHKLHKSKSGHDQQMLLQQQQQQQMQVQQQQFSQQQSFQQSAAFQQSSSSVAQQSFQQSSSVQQASSFQQASSTSFQQASSSSFQQAASFQQSSMSSVQQSSTIQSSSSFQQSGGAIKQQQQLSMKEPEPEVIYLKHVERQGQQQMVRKEEVVHRYPAPQLMGPLKDVTVVEGERAHFEAKVGPVGDPSMVVEWYFNGTLIAASSRINTACQFGFVSMDMLNSTLSDAGEYSCLIRTDSGSVQSSCRLAVSQRPELEAEMHHSSSLEHHQYQQQQQTVTVVQEEKVPPPKFTRKLQNLEGRMEGSSVKLEAQVTPTSDSSMKIDWFKDGRPITASSRISSMYSFGYVSLNISGLRADDSGTYTCRATNKSGEDMTQATVTVKASTSLTASTGLEEQHAYIQKTEQLEQYQAAKMTRSSEVVIEQPSQAPEFKTSIKDQLEVKEGGFAHFEARLEPMGDHTMKVEWLKDGRPVEASSRITSFFNFGYVALTVKQVAAHDQGTYSCVATNACGRAETKAQLRTVAKTDGDFQSKTWESIQKMETRKVESSRMEVFQEVTSAPKFVSSLKGTNVILEGQKAHFECRIEPQNDPKLQIQWFHNGQILTASSRIQTFHDFGYVAIDINNVKKEDSGTYTLVATNVLGTERAEVLLKVEAHAQIDYTSLHAKTIEETRRFETKQEVKHQEVLEVQSHGPPVFKTTLVDPEPVSEGQNIHLEARLEPIGDPSLKVDWFFNGRPLTIGSRFKTYNDFGFIALDILGVTGLDHGQYVCRARNQAGEAATSANVQVVVKSSIITETENESAMQQISYLESEKVQLLGEEEAVRAAPTFTKPLRNVEAPEGQNIHLEARLAPTGDSTMRIEWTVNGKPLKTGHRFRPAYDFDYVALDLLSVYPEDSGVYTCHARNAYGEAVSSATIKIFGQTQVVSETRMEMKQFQSLEQKSSSTRTEIHEEVTSQAPVFTSSPKSVDVKEGQKVHFEARIIPVSDPTLKVEWFLNGQPIKQGSRFREGLDFGFVFLDISHVLAEDAGQYTCRATNILGQAVCSCSLSVKVRETIVKDTIHESALQQINYLETQRVTQTQEEGLTTQAPIFTASMRDLQVVEGAPAHFEAKLVPIGDPKLKVEWLKDGKPIDASNRMSTLHDFGFVAMDLKYTRPSDSGRYSIRAVNTLGEATVSANLRVVSAQAGADMETMHEEALTKIAYLERGKTRGGLDLSAEEAPQTAPMFAAQLQGKTQLLEGQNAHFECRIDPYPDPTLRVEWFHNGRPLPFGNRWRTSYDFGFAALDIIGCYAQDAGRYTIKATNILGSAESSVEVKIASGKGLLLDTDHAQALQKIKHLESKHQRTAEEELAAPEPPQFGHPLKNMVLEEGQPAHFETTLTPVNDGSMRVEWLFNGKAVAQGHRFRTTYDFGFVALDILYAYPEDSGTYTCVAKNVLGETRTECTLQVAGKAGLLLDTMDRDRLAQLRNLEHKDRSRQEDPDAPITKPVFTTPLNSVEGAAEGGHVHLECRLEPVNDPNLRVEWFVNGKTVKTGHRFRTTHDFGFVALDILTAYAEDSGTYMCKATNRLGEAVNTGSVTVIARKGLLLDSQHPEGWEKMRELESRRRVARLEVEEVAATAPKFLTQLQGLTTLSEGQSAHFEAQVEPIHDPQLRVEFLHNGQLLQQASRIHTVCDFGYVALDIGQLVAADGGEYVCRAVNALGESSSAIRLSVTARGTLDTSSQRPEGLDKIKQLESRGQAARAEEVATFQKPVFTAALQNVVLAENQAAHLAARLIPVGDPSLKVDWFKDGKLLETGSRIKTAHEFGVVTLDIDSVRSSDVGIYTCKAVNMNGEATCTTSIKVQESGWLQGMTRHPGALDKIRDLESPRVTKVSSDPEVNYDHPTFTAHLANLEVAEKGTAVLECRVEPAKDPTMKIDWQLNGRPLPSGTKFIPSFEFGLVRLEIRDALLKDAGMFKCTATNNLGIASTAGTLHVLAEAAASGPDAASLHPSGQAGLAAIQSVDQAAAAKHLLPEVAGDTEPGHGPPRFTTDLPAEVRLRAEAHLVLECALEPQKDPGLRVDWYHNGLPLASGTRLVARAEFGQVSLTVNGLTERDAGIYTCKAVNALGEAATFCRVYCEAAAGGVDATTKHPRGVAGLESIAGMEVKGRLPGEDEADTQQAVTPPRFTQDFADGELEHGALGHFEALLEPKNEDIALTWLFNGKPLKESSRFKRAHAFGMVVFEIVGVRAADEGAYTCVASNKAGRAEASFHLRFCAGKAKLAPKFTTQLKDIKNLRDGMSAHFECRVSPAQDPNLRIEWKFNGRPLQDSSRIKPISDFGFVVLDIAGVDSRDSGEYICTAINKFGSDTTRAVLECEGRSGVFSESLRPDSLHKIRALETGK